MTTAPSLHVTVVIAVVFLQCLLWRVACRLLYSHTSSIASDRHMLPCQPVTNYIDHSEHKMVIHITDSAIGQQQKQPQQGETELE